jgi:hypothetical protein
VIAELRAVIADLRADRDAWRKQAQRLVLPAPKPVEQPLAIRAQAERLTLGPPNATPSVTPKRPWWRFDAEPQSARSRIPLGGDGNPVTRNGGREALGLDMLFEEAGLLL